MNPAPVVTFDVFSALMDSRNGGGAQFDSWAGKRGWSVSGYDVYDRWDAASKRAHRECMSWVPLAELARDALARTYAKLDLRGDPDADAERLLASMSEWPLWPDVERGVGEVSRHLRVGLLSNIDDVLLERTPVVDLPVDPALFVTSERVRAYKPHPAIYAQAQRILGPFVHVASSARDVRGSLEAGLPVVRLRRPGHELDSDGPRPRREVASTIGLVPVLHDALRGAGDPSAHDDRAG